MYVIAFAITYYLFQFQIRERKLSVKKDDVVNFFFALLLGMLLGARIIGTTVYDVTGRYLQAPWLIFWPFDDRMQFTGFAGLSFHGGLVGIILAAVIYTRIKKIDLLRWGDMLATAVPLGYTFGRIGNFINSELWGRVTTMPWGIVFPNGEPLPVSEPWVQSVMAETGITASGPMVNLPRHPSQLYEAFGEGILLWLIFWFIFRKKTPFRGFVMGLYLIGYGVVRFLVEYLRTPDKGLDFPLMFEPVTTTSHLHISLINFSTGQILSSLMIIGGVAAMFVFWLWSKRVSPEGGQVSENHLAKASPKRTNKSLRKRIK